MIRGLGRHGSCLVPRQIRLLPGPWSVRLALGQGSDLGSQTGGWLPGVQRCGSFWVPGKPPSR